MDYDLCISNGTIVDGTGRTGFMADILIKDDKIIDLVPCATGNPAEIIDAGGLIVCPGFIDIHAHSEFSLLAMRDAQSKIRQGVTTEIVGNCGFSAAPVSQKNPLKESILPYYEVSSDWADFNEYFEKLESTGIVVNIGSLVGQSTVRGAVLGSSEREATPSELELMKREVAKALDAGAYGLSIGFPYAPGCFAGIEEIQELALAAGCRGGFISAHIRNQSTDLVPSILELIDIGEYANAAVQVSHLKAVGKENWGRSGQALEVIDHAIARGIDVTADTYPYTAHFSPLTSYVPRTLLADGKTTFQRRLEDADYKSATHDELVAAGRGIENTLVCRSGNVSIEGQDICEIAARRAQDVYQTVLDLLEENIDTWAIGFEMCEQDIKNILKSKHVMIGSDGESLNYDERYFKGEKVHPRYYGTFPRILGKYVREEHVLGIAEAVNKMTLKPAQRLGLTDRGMVAKGMVADIAIFDSMNISDQATYESPFQFPVGIPHVIVNGVPVIKEGRFTGRRAGKILRKRN